MSLGESGPSTRYFLRTRGYHNALRFVETFSKVRIDREGSVYGTGGSPSWQKGKAPSTGLWHILHSVFLIGSLIPLQEAPVSLLAFSSSLGLVVPECSICSDIFNLHFHQAVSLAGRADLGLRKDASEDHLVALTDLPGLRSPKEKIRLQYGVVHRFTGRIYHSPGS